LGANRNLPEVGKRKSHGKLQIGGRSTPESASRAVYGRILTQVAAQVNVKKNMGEENR
jgi:hypothetical protein